MTALTIPQIAPVTVTNSSTTLYTVPNVAGNTFVCKSIMFLNVTGSAVTISVARVASGGSEADTNRFLKAISIGPSETFMWEGVLTLAQNESIRATSSAASSVTATVSGVLDS